MNNVSSGSGTFQAESLRIKTGWLWPDTRDATALKNSSGRSASYTLSYKLAAPELWDSSIRASRLFKYVTPAAQTSCCPIGGKMELLFNRSGKIAGFVVLVFDKR